MHFKTQQRKKRKKKEKKKERPGLPLDAERFLEYTADEGTFISLDVSPDGKSIVFDLLGDLYTMPISGGKATRITSGMSYDVQPRFSPDGKKIVFISDSSGTSNVWLYDIEKKETKAFTKGDRNAHFSPEFTPDGKYIVSTKSRSTTSALGKLWIYHIDGGRGSQIAPAGVNPNSGVKMIGAAFGKDSRYVYYAQRFGDWQYNAVFPQYQIVRLDMETGDRSTITSRYGSAIRPAVSPDGKYLAYATRYKHETGLILRNLATSKEEWLAYPIQRDDQESRGTLDVLPGYSFTPDNKHIIMSYGGKIWKIDVKSKTDTEIKFSADVKIGLGPEVRFNYDISDASEFDVRQIRHPVVSPDGKKMVFTAMDRLWVRDMKTKKAKRLTNQNVGEFYPSWSWDSKWIAFSTWDDNKGGHVYKISASGRSLTKLTKEAAIYYETAWSPDNSRIVSVKSVVRDLKEALWHFTGGQDRRIVAINSNGRRVSEVMPAEGRYQLHFTNDRNRIYAYRSGIGLISFRFDGTDEKTHVNVTGRSLGFGSFTYRPTYMMMAPKGDQAMVHMLNQLYVVTVPKTGTTPTISLANPKSTSFPARQLTDIGAEFASWDASGRTLYWAIGNAFHWFDLDEADRIDDVIKKEKDEEKKKKEAEAKKKAEEKDKEKNEKKDDDADGAKDSDGNIAKTDSDNEKKEEEKKKTEPYKAEHERIIIKSKRDVPNGEVLLSGARLITMNGKEIFESGDIHIKNDKIVAVGAKGSLNVPSNVKSMDMSGKTIIPGFVDTHSHNRVFWNIHTQQHWNYITNVAYGVTTSRDPQTASTDILSYSDMVKAGHMIGPRAYSTGPGVFSSETIKTYKDAENILKRYSEFYDTKTYKMYMTGNRKMRQYLIMASKELGLMPTTEGGLDYKLNLTHALDGYSGLEHSLPVTPLYSDIQKLFTTSQITYSPTLLVAYGGPWAENYYYTTDNVHDDPKLNYFTPYREVATKTLRRNGFSGWFH